ncbi:MAG: GFA family protein [Betaproteobacteria bacterium]|nr:GFA family protein [Betaproteobacteria bacterium]
MTASHAIARCHCGAVEFRAAFPSRFVAHCFCQSCRTAHAAGSVTWIGFKKNQVELVKGAEFINNYESSPNTWRKFCTQCGTRLAFESAREADWADEFHMPLALFVTPVDRKPHVNSFLEERPQWAPYHEF